jgi:hypothetical protein
LADSVITTATLTKKQINAHDSLLILQSGTRSFGKNYFSLVRHVPPRHTTHKDNGPSPRDAQLKIQDAMSTAVPAPREFEHLIWPYGPTMGNYLKI